LAATADEDLLETLRLACQQAGIGSGDSAEPISLGENAIFRVPGSVVVRIARPGQQAAARREITVATWMEDSGIPAVQALRDIPQPVEVGQQAITFWRELPPHRGGTYAEIGAALRRLHATPPPSDLALGTIAPFVRLGTRIEGATTLAEDERTWLQTFLAQLEAEWHELPQGQAWCVVHGDAHGGNIVATEDGRVVMLDLERTSFGPPEWDTAQTATYVTSFGWGTAADYDTFCHAYGHDVTAWDGFPLLRSIRELRMTTWLAQLASTDASLHAQVEYRVACLRGQNGSRPWRDWVAGG
jgi:Ser/Thr protein kinase RdoA (MazF antagonist)